MNARCGRAATAPAARPSQAGRMRRSPYGRAVAALLVAALAAVGAQPAPPAWDAEGEVRYEASDAWATWSGRAPLEAVELALDPDDLGTLRVTVLVRPAAFDSRNALRDARARASVFQVAAHPVATLVATAAAGAVGSSIRAGETRTVPIEAELTLHGTTLPYRLALTLTRPAAGDDGSWRAEAAFTVSLGAHGMRRPALLGLVTDDEVRVFVQATGRPAPTPTPTTP